MKLAAKSTLIGATATKFCGCLARKYITVTRKGTSLSRKS